MSDKKYYVYELIDPRPEKELNVFYVGKGSNNRMYHHFNRIKKGYKLCNDKLEQKLKKIIKCGYNKIIYNKIFFSNDEGLTYVMEEIQIAYYGLENLCNICKGGLGANSKPWEITYGIEKANKMKETRSSLYQGENNPFYGKIHPHNGKNYIEIYGEKKANEIKRKQSKPRGSNSNGLKGKTYEQIHGKEEASRLKKQKSKKLKGITLEKRYGKEEANRIKKERSEKISKSNKGKNQGTQEQKYGEKKADEMKKVNSERQEGISWEIQQGKNNPMYKDDQFIKEDKK